MIKILFGGVASALLVLLLAGMGPQVGSTCFNAPNCALGLDASGNPATGAPPKFIPVCNRFGLIGDGGLSSAAFPQSNSRQVMKCPNGANFIQFVLPGIYAIPQETDLTDEIPVTMGIEVDGGTGCVATQTCATIIPVTCGGQPVCRVPVQPTGAVDQAFILTDPVPVNVSTCATGLNNCTIAVRNFVNQALGQLYAAGRPVLPALGEGTEQHAIGDTDKSVSGTIAAATSATLAQIYEPVAAIGVPKLRAPTVCIVGASVTSGFWGPGVKSAAVAAGGSGYTVGDVLTLVGGTFGGTGTAGAAQFTVATLGASNAVATVNLSNPGIYTATGFPGNPVSTTGGTGSGATLTLSGTNTNSKDYPGDTYGDQGYVERALANNLAWVQLSRSGDRASYWTTRDRSRIAMIQAIGCSSVYFELGENDITAGVSAATLEADVEGIWQQLFGIGVHVFAGTLIPNANTSTDAWATLGNQTVAANDAVRVTYNTWLRANYTTQGLSGLFETAWAIESSHDSGKFLVNGQNCYPGCDGSHLQTALITLEQAVIIPGNFL